MKIKVFVITLLLFAGLFNIASAKPTLLVKANGLYQLRLPPRPRRPPAPPFMRHRRRPVRHRRSVRLPHFRLPPPPPRP